MGLGGRMTVLRLRQSRRKPAPVSDSAHAHRVEHERRVVPGLVAGEDKRTR